jgi:hypothetical protein
MFPNLDLILLALLHASFVFFVLLIVIIILFFILLLTFSLALLSIFLLDLHHYFCVFYEYFEFIKGDLELGLVLILISLIHHGVDSFLVSKPRHKRMTNLKWRHNNIHQVTFMSWRLYNKAILNSQDSNYVSYSKEIDIEYIGTRRYDDIQDIFYRQILGGIKS